jgi:hypothetical protein
VGKSKLVYKYLDAGAKGSPVVIDPGLETFKEQTIYLYHHLRDEIIEYRRDIVEPKLRELTGAEIEMEDELEKDYKKARTTFKPRGANAPNVTKRETAAKAPVKSIDEIEMDTDSGSDYDDEEFDD